VPGTILEMQLRSPDGRTCFLKGIVRRSIKLPIADFKSGMGVELIEKDAVYYELVKSLNKGEVSDMETMVPEFKIVSCPNCHTKNKIPVDKISMGPRCGRCRMPLIIAMP